MWSGYGNVKANGTVEADAVDPWSPFRDELGWPRDVWREAEYFAVEQSFNAAEHFSLEVGGFECGRETEYIDREVTQVDIR